MRTANKDADSKVMIIEEQELEELIGQTEAIIKVKEGFGLEARVVRSDCSRL